MKRVLSALAAVTMVLSLAACGGQSAASESSSAATSGSETATAESSEEIVITYPTYRVGTHVSAGTEAKLIEGFNEAYKGKYRVEIEELPSDSAYTEKMKVLASTNALPDVVEGKDGILELAIRNGQAVDLTEFVNADPEFKAEIGEDAINANTIDGKLYSISHSNQLIGYFYNKEHFADAGITPAKTWDEFMSNLEALKAAGHTPISMMTGENCWVTNLLLASMVGTDGEAGNTFMTTKNPGEYNTPEMVKALTMMQTILQQYTTQDALGAKYDIAANHFMQGDTSIICNGPWMTTDFTNPEKAMEGFADKVGVALYPNNGAFAQYEIGYMVCASDPAKQEAAFEFIKYKTNAEAQLLSLEENGVIPLTSNVELSEEYVAENPLVAELIELSASAEYKYNTFDNMSPAGVIETMSKSYPSLAMGDITPEEMCDMMTEAAAKNQ